MKIILTTLLTFISTFSLIAQNQDCASSLNLLTKDSITVEEINGSGLIIDEITNSCLNSIFPEDQSTWYTFTAYEAGNFYFTIKPINPQDDLDFYLLKATAQTCASAVSVRCNASSCVGTNGYTGMTPDDEDTFEDLNCEEGENGFVKDVYLNKGDVYYLMVNNFTGNAGYTIVFCGTAKLSEDDVVCTREETSSVEIYSEKKFRITPNPSNNFFSISDYQAIDKIEIYSTQGSLVNTNSFIENKINVDLIPGMYYCKIFTKENTISIVPFVRL